MKKKYSGLLSLIIACVLLLDQSVILADAQGANNTSTNLLISGPTGQKRNLVIIGDGFQAGNDQNTFDTWVTNEVINGVFQRGPFWEDMNAFNIIRINAISVDTGVTQVDNTGKVTTARNTALDFRVSGIWSRCWNELGTNSNSNITNILNSLAPGWNYIIIVLNDPNAGGCRRGNQLAVGVNENWNVLQHEMGHMIGNLCDEYVGGTSPGNYSGGEPGCVNLTINTNHSTIKWGDFIDPITALPTTFNNATMDQTETVGAFEGGTLGTTGYSTGIWRPTSDGAMRNNLDLFGPVDYNRIKEVLKPFHQYNYLDSYTGDFNGDGRADVVIQNANSIALYLSTSDALTPTWIATGSIPGWDGIAEHDRFFVGDFNGDNLDDLYVVNFNDYADPWFGMLRSTGNSFECVAVYGLELPGWDDMRLHDQFYVADFDRDGKDDLYVFNGQDWRVGYLIMLRSTGSSLQYIQRFDDTLPGWDSMRQHDQFFPADFDGNGFTDLYIFNGKDWSMGYLQLMRSTGTTLQYVRRFDDILPGWDSMRQHDQFFPADFNGDGLVDLYVFNAQDWAVGYLEILQATENNLVPVQLYEDLLPGWDRMLAGDKYQVADINGDKMQDLYVFNYSDWDTEYLGEIISDGKAGLVGYWQADWIGGWNLGSSDMFLVGNFNGGSGWDDLFIRNKEWFGLLISNGHSTALEAIYPKWIHQVRYHKLEWWE